MTTNAIKRVRRLCFWSAAACIAALAAAVPAAALIDNITVNVVPNPAEQSSTVALSGYCEYSTGETFRGAGGGIDGTPFTLTADGPPVDVGGGLTRQNLTGTATAPSSAGTFTVGAGCDTDSSTASGLQNDLVVTATTTTTTITTTTTSTPPATTTTTTPAAAGGASSGAPLSITG